MNSIPSVQWQHTNQHSLLSWTSSYYLKLWLCSRQMAQHISWSQGCSTSPLISKSTLWTSILVWTTPDNISVIWSGMRTKGTSVYGTIMYERENLVSNVRVVNEKLGFFIFFLFYFSLPFSIYSILSFIFIFIILDLGKEVWYDVITSFFLITILYNSAHKRISKYITFFCFKQPTRAL